MVSKNWWRFFLSQPNARWPPFSVILGSSSVCVFPLSASKAHHAQSPFAPVHDAHSHEVENGCQFAQLNRYKAVNRWEWARMRLEVLKMVVHLSSLDYPGRQESSVARECFFFISLSLTLLGDFRRLHFILCFHNCFHDQNALEHYDCILWHSNAPCDWHTDDSMQSKRLKFDLMSEREWKIATKCKEFERWGERCRLNEKTLSWTGWAFQSS